jgi:hypothetical protein
MRLATFLATLAGLAVLSRVPPAPSAQEDAEAIQVMILGTYHMAPSGRDIVNVEVESVLSDLRQSELADVAEALATFHPTVVATERETAAPEFVDPEFARTSPEVLAANPNERVQVAYRLATLAGVTRVHGIDEFGSDDEPDYFPYGELLEHAEKTGQTDVLEAMTEEARAIAADFSASQAENPIAQLLIDVNTGPLSSPSVYYRFLRLDRGDAQPGAELNAYWFMRNAKIFSKLAQVTRPGDRVVVVYGVGHKHWLEHLVDQTPGFVRVDPVPYLEKALDR